MGSWIADDRTILRPLWWLGPSNCEDLSRSIKVKKGKNVLTNQNFSKEELLIKQ